jgi:hypothetical protein
MAWQPSRLTLSVFRAWNRDSHKDNDDKKQEDKFQVDEEGLLKIGTGDGATNFQGTFIKKSNQNTSLLSVPRPSRCRKTMRRDTREWRSVCSLSDLQEPSNVGKGRGSRSVSTLQDASRRLPKEESSQTAEYMLSSIPVLMALTIKQRLRSMRKRPWKTRRRRMGLTTPTKNFKE